MAWRRKRPKRKTRIPSRRIAEKLAIWESYRDPVGFKFYGSYRPKGVKETKHFEFSVIVPRSMRRKVMYFWARETVRKMIKGRKLPSRHYYHAYRSFMYLHGLEWEKVDRIVSYDVRHTAT